jgi:hypothetical protein
MNQYVYLIRCQQYYKIGVANDVSSRLAQLSTGNPFPLEVLATYEFANAEFIEKALHQRFENRWERGEWFSLNPPEIDIFHRVCEMLGGKSFDVDQTIDDEEVEDAEEAQETMAEGAKWDFRAMFADGWRIDTNNGGKIWRWRKGSGAERKSIAGGSVSNLPYSVEETRRVFRKEEKDFCPTKRITVISEEAEEQNARADAIESRRIGDAE